jgi:NAD(P)H-dependent FMN reductase
MRRLLIVWHTQLGGTAQLAAAAIAGARGVDGVETLAMRAHEAGVAQVLAADAYLFGCSENFGGIAGAFKDFLERVYYPCEARLEGRAWSAFVCAGSDGSNAMLGLERIATGLRLRKVHPGFVWRSGEVARRLHVPDEALGRCRELGATIAAGLSAGLW